MTIESWDKHFLRIAYDCADMSKDPNTQVGAVIVGPDREIRSTGFNGFARGIYDGQSRMADTEYKNKLIVHAETNAICNAARVGVSLKGCTLYLLATDDSDARWGGPPCIPCAMAAIQSGIKTIKSLPFKQGPSRWRESIEEARLLLIEAGVDYVELKP